VWLVGFVRALQLRPIVVSRDTISVRIGLQWSLDVPRAAIESVTFGRVKVAPRGTPEWIRGLPSPNVLLTLREPLVAEGPYGIKRRIRFVALSLDDVAAFRALHAG